MTIEILYSLVSVSFSPYVFLRYAFQVCLSGTAPLSKVGKHLDRDQYLRVLFYCYPPLLVFLEQVSYPFCCELSDQLITVSITCRLMEFWISRFVEASSASHYHPVITPFLLHKLHSDKNKLSHIVKIKLFLETRSHGKKYHARLWSRKIVHVPQIFCLQVIITVITLMCFMKHPWFV